MPLSLLNPLIYDNNTQTLILLIIPEMKENPYLQKKQIIKLLLIGIRNHFGSWVFTPKFTAELSSALKGKSSHIYVTAFSFWYFCTISRIQENWSFIGVQVPVLDYG